MYEIGQRLLYGIHGICTITGIEGLRFGKDRANYYVLEPKDQPGAKFYVPVANEAADENQRKLLFRELINSGDRAQLMGMIGALHRHRREQLAVGRKFHQSDENFLNDAQKILKAEFSLVFDLDPNAVNSFVLRELENTH